MVYAVAFTCLLQFHDRIRRQEWWLESQCMDPYIYQVMIVEESTPGLPGGFLKRMLSFVSFIL